MNPKVLDAAPVSRHFGLRRGSGLWELDFAGERAPLKNEIGLRYVAYLLAHPSHSPIHAVELDARVRRSPRDVTEGCKMLQRSLGLDDLQAALSLHQEEMRLQAILNDPDETEPVKAEVMRQLEEMARFQNLSVLKTRDLAAKIAESVRKAVRRFLARLEAGEDTSRRVRREFAAHLRTHLVFPTGRLGPTGIRRPRTSGGYAYPPPPGVSWTIEGL